MTHFISNKLRYFCSTFLSEGTSRAALESLYAGLPCILSDVDGNFELIQSENKVVYLRKPRTSKCIEFFLRQKLVNQRKLTYFLKPTDSPTEHKNTCAF